MPVPFNRDFLWIPKKKGFIQTHPNAGPKPSKPNPPKDREIQISDLLTGQPKLTLAGHTRGVAGIAYSNEYRYLLSAGRDHYFKVACVNMEYPNTKCIHARCVDVHGVQCVCIYM